jgi:hypothetical protein
MYCTLFHSRMCRIEFCDVRLLAPWLFLIVFAIVSLVASKLRQYHADFVMSDPAQLRKCEELLGTLPDQPPARARNPVWVFLKGIEGFDAERASECLVRLLDKHYDTIEVLATKRDLVEDAGILPGDALRIVAAARHYVAPRDADHSPGTLLSPSPSPSPVLHRCLHGTLLLLLEWDVIIRVEWYSSSRYSELGLFAFGEMLI